MDAAHLDAAPLQGVQWGEVVLQQTHEEHEVIANHWMALTGWHWSGQPFRLSRSCLLSSVGILRDV